MPKTRFTAILSTFILCMGIWVLITWSFSVQELRRVLKTAFETDNRIKSGLFDERLALQMLIAEI